MPRSALACLAALAALISPAHAAPRVERVTTKPLLYDTTAAAVSQDGRWVAVSAAAAAPRVVAGQYAPNWYATPVLGPTLAQPVVQVWLVDRVTKTATLVSKGPDGKPADKDAYVGSISADGRYVVFRSSATNLAKGAVYDCAYLYDRVTRRLSLVSLDWQGKPHSIGAVPGVRLSPDGSTILFLSDGAMVRNGKSAGYVVYARDRRTGVTRAVTKEPTYSFGDMSTNRSGRYLAVTSASSVDLYDVKTGALRGVRGPVSDDARCPQQADDMNVCGYVVTGVAVDAAGAKVAYVVSTTNGSTRVVVTTVATGASTAVASFSGDLLSDVTDVTFSLDGSALYWVGPPSDAASATGTKVLYKYALGTGVRSVVTALPSAAACRTDGCVTARLTSVAPFANGVLFTTDAPLVADDTDGLMDAYAVIG